MEHFRSECKLYPNKVSNSLWLGWGGKSCWMKVYIIPSTTDISFIWKISLLIYLLKCIDIFVVVQLLSHVWVFATSRTAARQASLSFTISQSLLKLTSVELVMPSNHLVLCRPLLLLPSVFPSIRVFSNESAHRIRWPKYLTYNTV